MEPTDPVDALLARHPRALEPMPPVVKVLTVLGGAFLGVVITSLLHREFALAITATVIAGMLLSAMARRVVRRVRMRADIKRTREELHRGRV